MSKFISLKELRDRVWPLAAEKKVATDMTAVSLPILDYSKNMPCVKFMVYYAVPSSSPSPQPSQISRPYALFTLDLITGKLLNYEELLPDDAPKPLIGDGVSAEVLKLPKEERRNLQFFFFSRCDEIAKIFGSKELTIEQVHYIKDLLDLYETLSEPPLVQDYEVHGKAFFSWLRANVKSNPAK